MTLFSAMALVSSGYRYDMGWVGGGAPLCLGGGRGLSLGFVEKVTNGCLWGMGSTFCCFHPKLYIIRLKVIKAFRVCSSSGFISRVRVSTYVNESVAMIRHLGDKRLLLSQDLT